MQPLRGVLTALWALPVLLASPLSSTAPAAEATFNVDVPAGEWKAARVRNLPKGAIVALEVESSGPVGIAFVNTKDYGSYPSTDRPLFKGRVDRTLSVSMTTPDADHYYVVLDNRSGKDSRAIEVKVQAARGDSADAGAISGGEASKKEPDDDLASVDRKLQEFELNLQKIFIFERFPIRAERCGKPAAFTGPDGIVLCQEFAQELYSKLGDKEKAADALLFTLFHELGHVLLRQWDYPVYDNEDVADEYAAVVMILLGQRERVQAAAEYFAANAPVAESLAKTFRDDRHPLSQQRARNILRWIKDPDLVRKWQTLLIPHMQTPILEKLRETPPEWTDVALVEKELRERQ